jgi:hypothetical protein
MQNSKAVKDLSTRKDDQGNSGKQQQGRSSKGKTTPLLLAKAPYCKALSGLPPRS